MEALDKLLYSIFFIVFAALTRCAARANASDDFRLLPFLICIDTD
jgi:hypothetical protein